MRKYRLAVITSHPIQYQGPFFKALAKNPEIDLMVYFSLDFGVHKKSYDEEFGKALAWDRPLLDGYNFQFLKNFSPKASSGFWGQINPGIVSMFYRKRPDAFLVFGWNGITQWLGVVTALFLKVPVFIRGENPLSHEMFKNPVKKSFKRIILGWLFRHASALLAIGEENKKFYEYYGARPEKIIIAPYAVDNDWFISQSSLLFSQKQELKKLKGIPENAVVTLFVGKLISKKRPFDLLRACARTENEKSALVFVGSGELEEGLKKEVQEKKIPNVFFAGFQNQTELPQWYALADVLVLPSGEGETWGLVVNEAMCFSLPVIVSDMVGCGPDLVRENKNGFIFSLRDIGALTATLQKLLGDDKKREEFGKKSLEIIKNYSYEKDIEAILRALKMPTG